MAVSAIVGGALVGAGATAYSANKAASAQKKAQRQAARDAEDARKRADREFNRANQKSPNVAALAKRNRAASTSGTSGTFLTGNASTSSSGGMLGRTTLLGG